MDGPMDGTLLRPRTRAQFVQGIGILAPTTGRKHHCIWFPLLPPYMLASLWRYALHALFSMTRALEPFSTMTHRGCQNLLSS